jgi:hypothetical protein
MPNALGNFLAPSRAEIDQEKYGNALLRNQVNRLPQANRMQDLSIQGAEQELRAGDQQFSDQQRKAAAGIAANMALAVAQSPDPVKDAQSLFSNPQFVSAVQFLGLQAPTFDAAKDTPDSLKAGAATFARSLGAQVPQQLRTFEREGALLQEDPTNGKLTQVMTRPPQGPTPKGPDAPSGYEFNADGSLRPIKGGPADPQGPNNRRNSMQLRKEYEDQEAVKTYRTVLPLYERAAKAPDSRAGDISVIYALGKMFDPGSVVREGELQLSMNAAPWLQQMAAGIKSQITGEGRLTPPMRATILDALNGQVEALRQPYEQERARYGQYASDSGMTPDSVVGPDPAAAFQPKGGGGWTVVEVK